MFMCTNGCTITVMDKMYPCVYFLSVSLDPYCPVATVCDVCTIWMRSFILNFEPANSGIKNDLWTVVVQKKKVSGPFVHRLFTYRRLKFF